MDKLLFDDRHKNAYSKHNKDKRERAFERLDKEIDKILDMENYLKEGLNSHNSPRFNRISMNLDQAFE